MQRPPRPSPPGQTDDPWTLWVFNIRAGANLEGESQQSFQSLNGSLSANRTAADLKVNISVFGRYNRSDQELTDTTFVNTSRFIEGDQLVVWSLRPHGSAGFRGNMRISTFVNQDIAIGGGPAIEYNVYPYDESTRRLFTIFYSPEIARYDYEEVTIFDKSTETLPVHRLEMGFTVRQPWGNINTSAGAIQHPHDLSKHRITVSGSVSVRIIRGLDFQIGGNAARIKDQLYLPKGGLTDEEILVRRRQLGTSVRYWTFMNLSFRFGSKFANIVNPRMRGGGGGLFF